MKINSKEIGYGLIFIAVILIFFSIRLFFIGFHNVDLVFNYQKLNIEINPHLEEAGIALSDVNEAMDSMGKDDDMKLIDVYELGTSQELTSLPTMFLAGLCLCLGIIFIEKERK